MSQEVRHESAFKVVGPDGTAVYVGTAIIRNTVEVQSGEASATIAAGEAVRADVTNSVIPTWDAATSKTSLIQGLRASGAVTDVGWIGVAVTNILPGKVGVVAGAGSILSVKCIASLTSATAGNPVLGSTTAGSVDANTTAAVGRKLGILLQGPGTGAAQSGSTTQAGIIVAQA